MDFSTKNQREAAKLVLQILGKDRLPPRKVVDLVHTHTGYEKRQSVQDLVEDMVAADDFVVEHHRDKLERRDIEYETDQGVQA